MIMEPNVFRFLSGDEDILEVTLLQKLSSIKKLGALNTLGFGKVWIRFEINEN